jgi:flavin-dependent dehydrogenase
VEARHVVLATGKHDLRGHGRPPGPQPDLIGFKMYFDLAREQRSTIDRRILLGLFPGGYAGLQPVEDGRANLCLVLRQSRFATLGRDWGSLMAMLATDVPSLGCRLAGAVPAWPRPLAIAGIPYGFVATDPEPASLWRLGDQMAVIPSFSGDGMSIALHSAQRAATSLLNSETNAMLTARLRRDLGAQVARATAASRLFVHPAAQTLLLGAARCLPSLLTLGAKATRVPERARRIAAKG